MAVAEVAQRPQPERSSRRKPFAQWVRNLASLKNKGSDPQEKGGTKKNSKKSQQAYNDIYNKNNPYPESGYLQQPRQSEASSANGQQSVPGAGSFGSFPNSTTQEQEANSTSNQSGSATVATNPETIHSDAGHSKAATTTTHGGIDGTGAGSTFSSPTHSQRSLTTTLTTIQSTGANQTLQGASGSQNSNLHGSLNNPNPVLFSHQYPVSPAPSTSTTISALPRHITENLPTNYNSATANGLLTDNASIITLASSSKRRRRSMDTDASVRAMAPNSIYGGSRESLPLSVLSHHADAGQQPGSVNFAAQSRPSIGGLASAERASVYSSQGVGVASERNSYYSFKPGKDLADARSLRSITNMDARSLNADAKSMGGDVGSLRTYESSIKSGKAGHSRNDSIPGSLSGPMSNSSLKHASGAISRRSSDWQRVEAEDNDEHDKHSIEAQDFDVEPNAALNGEQTTGTNGMSGSD